ncbi:unnamed protein product [Phytophthora fragariaefolia]|uniref:Unnamed protein product n=1 Tax=Phytophthora fragariaefolia TaxID=1490495 RepID=A0A9W6X108_9STRA|nr:unnamed protein product [Phytophthora fragariaefolia]
MPSMSRRLLFVSAAFLVLYSVSLIFVWVKWAKMKDYATTSLNKEIVGENLDVDESRGYPRQAWRKHEFKCLGWVETDDAGDEQGSRRECWQRIQAGDAGYCEVQNITSGEVFHVMHTTSLSLKDDTRFTCELAKDFSSFQFFANAYRHDPPMVISQSVTQGIVMAVYGDVLPSAFASIHRLRDIGCKLPIELWFRHDELTPENSVLMALAENFGPIHFRQIFDERIYGFNVKVHALYYSQFANVLLLDADNFAVRDPTPLFSTPAMKTFGAVFWPDFWSPQNSIFNLHAQSLVWELLGLDYVNMAEQESGQVMVNRATSKPMLERLVYFATHKPNLFTKLKLVWGDKDLFRLAWLQMKKSFYYNDRRIPGTLGIINRGRQRYCGVTMVQYDLDGDKMLFWHRNTIKLSGRGDDRHVWYALQELSPVGAEYGSPKIQSYSGERIFNETSCFGIKRYEINAGVQMKRVAELGTELNSLEDTLIKYARQAYKLLHGDTAVPNVVTD